MKATVIEQDWAKATAAREAGRLPSHTCPIAQAFLREHDMRLAVGIRCIQDLRNLYNFYLPDKDACAIIDSFDREEGFFAVKDNPNVELVLDAP